MALLKLIFSWIIPPYSLEKTLQKAQQDQSEMGSTSCSLFIVRVSSDAERKHRNGDGTQQYGSCMLAHVPVALLDELESHLPDFGDVTSDRPVDRERDQMCVRLLKVFCQLPHPVFLACSPSHLIHVAFAGSNQLKLFKCNCVAWRKT